MARKKCQSAAWIPLFSPCTSTGPISSTSICSKPSGRSSCAQDIFVKGLSCVRSEIAAKRRSTIGHPKNQTAARFQCSSDLATDFQKFRTSQMLENIEGDDRFKRAIRVCFQKFQPIGMVQLG